MSHPLPDERFFGPVTTWNRDVEVRCDGLCGCSKKLNACAYTLLLNRGLIKSFVLKSFINSSHHTNPQNYLEGVFGVEHLQRINRALCTPPITATIRVNTLRASPADALHELTTLLHSQIATGLCSTPYLHPQLPYVLQIPGSGPHTIDYAAAVDPDVGFVREIAVNRICGEAVLRGADVFVPGVMGATKSIEAGQIVAVSIAKEPPPNATTCRPLLRGTILYSAGDPAVPQDEERRASAAQAESLDRGSLHLGLGIVQLPRVQLFKEARGVAVKMLRRVFELPSMEGVLTGRGMLQNLPSIVAAHVLAPRPGARVMDMCASPGGKTTALAQLMGDQGELIALDRSHAKVQDIVNLCTELGVTCVKAYKMDASWACRKVAAAAAAATPTETETAGPPVAASVESKGSTAPSAKEQARAARRKAAAAQRGMPDPDSLVAARADLTDGFDPESFDHLLLVRCSNALHIT